MFKMAVFDMDGTLLKSNYELPSKTKEMFQYLSNKGIRPIIATGRPVELLKEYLIELDVQDYSITCNGNVISNWRKNSTLYQSNLKTETVKQMIQYASEHHFGFLLFTDDLIVSNDNERYHFYKERNKNLPDHLKSRFVLIDDYFGDISNLVVHKILLIIEQPSVYHDVFQTLDNDKELFITQSKEQFIDVGSAGNSKGDAVLRLCKHYGIDPTEVIVFGDQHNDLPMFHIAGKSVAMGNATQKIKSHADEITSSCDEEGVLEYVFQFL